MLNVHCHLSIATYTVQISCSMQCEYKLSLLSTDISNNEIDYSAKISF